MVPHFQILPKMQAFSYIFLPAALAGATQGSCASETAHHRSTGMQLDHRVIRLAALFALWPLCFSETVRAITVNRDSLLAESVVDFG